MNAKSICTVCGNEFKYRRGKLYCSNSCKTKGFNLKKAGISGFDIEKPGESYNQARTTFYLSDYNKVKHQDFCSFELYCFLVKNFSDNEDVEFLNEYVEKIILVDSFDSDIKNNQHPIRKKYLQFLEHFHDGTYKIKKDRPLENIAN
ncbi:MAG: hypothetical protein ABI402_02955 [Ferruginibacter sp.]